MPSGRTLHLHAASHFCWCISTIFGAGIFFAIPANQLQPLQRPALQHEAPSSQSKNQQMSKYTDKIIKKHLKHLIRWEKLMTMVSKYIDTEFSQPYIAISRTL